VKYHPSDLTVRFQCVNEDCQERPWWRAKVVAVEYGDDGGMIPLGRATVVFEDNSPQNCPACGRFGEMVNA